MAERRIAIIISVQGAGDASAKLKKLNKNVFDFEKFIKKSTASLSAHVIAARMVSGAYTKVANSIIFGISQAVDFELAITKVAVIAGITGDEMTSLDSAVRDLAASSPKTATEVAKAALAMAKLGLSGLEVQNALEGVIGLSVALDENVESVGETMVNVKNVFDKEASELTSIADQMFTAFSNSALNLEKFGTAFSFAGGAANLAGVEFEDLTALMGILSNSGIKASTIGTQLRSIFIDLSDASSKAGRLIGGQTIETIGLEEALKRVRDAELSAGEAKSIFGKRAVSVIDILTKNIDKFTELSDVVKAAEGDVADASKTLEDTMANAAKRVSSEFTELNITLSKLYGPPVKAGLGAIADLFKILSGRVEDTGAELKETNGLLVGSFGIIGLARKTAEKESSLLEDARSERSMLRKADLDDIKKKQALKDEQEKEAARKAKEATDEQVRILKERFERLNVIRTQEALREFGLFDKRTREQQLQEVEGTGRAAGASGDIEKQLQAAKLAQDIKKSIFENDPETIAIKNRIATLKEEIEAKKLAEDEAKILHEQALERFKELDEKVKEQQELEKLQARNRQIFTGLFLQGLMDATRGIKSLSAVFKAAAIADTIASTYASAQKGFESALESGIPYPYNIIAGGATAAAITAAGLARVAAISNAASGFEGVVRSPTLMQVGEAGPERVSVTPSAKTARTGEQPGMVVHVHGSIIDRDGLMDAINQADQDISRSFVNV